MTQREIRDEDERSSSSQGYASPNEAREEREAAPEVARYNQHEEIQARLNQKGRKLREVAPPGRSLMRTRMPDAPGGMGISIRPLPREACLPPAVSETEDTWDSPAGDQEPEAPPAPSLPPPVASEADTSTEEPTS